MPRQSSRSPKPHAFRNKLLLNQWLISLLGVDPLLEHHINGKTVRPFHKLAEPIRDAQLEGLDSDNLHRFYHSLVRSPLFNYAAPTINMLGFRVNRDMLLTYEQNIVRHTQAINERRQRPVVWKYYQWLNLLFVEVYLDRYFGNRAQMLSDLNAYVDCFSQHWHDYANVPHYAEDDLNKLCFQNATGSGKTLLMHVNLLQYRHYAAQVGREQELSRVILLTPNESLSNQHMIELRESGILSANFAREGHGLFTQAQGLTRVDVLEITKLADQEGPNTIATRSLGDQNLLLVDEGHRGMSGKEEGVWFERRKRLCEKGFTFEYSATFEQAIRASANVDFENSYAKTVLFDYSYRWFYEDGFGKDYQILNLPESLQEIEAVYLTACLLKFYQQLRIFEENAGAFHAFNLEKPLWVFVGSTVSGTKLSGDEKTVATDVAQIIQFVADFLEHRQASVRRMREILTGKGQDTGLLDKDGNDIFAGSFTYLIRAMNAGEQPEAIYQDILARLFNNSAGGSLVLERIKGESGEIALRVGAAETPFGLINVGDAKALSDHIVEVAAQAGTKVTVGDSDFTEAMFASVKDSTSPVNLLIGSKKFIEGWDCWRVSTMGLMHVGRSEGTQILQLFGRGVRLKGYSWSLKRSGHARPPYRPPFIEELETLNVFGIEADFMEKFRDFLREEGLPGNERRHIEYINLNVTYDFGKKLKIIRPKRKAADGKEYEFKKDAPVPAVGDVPDYLTRNTVVADWYPRIQTMQSRTTATATQKDKVILREQHLAFLDFDALYLALEQFKRERGWYNLNISKARIRQLLADATWYTLYLPETRMNPVNYDGVLLLQQVATELLKRYCEHLYNYRKAEFIEPRLELRELSRDDENLPKEDVYQLIADGDEAAVIQAIQQIKKDLAEKKGELLSVSDLRACVFANHLFHPLFHVRPGGKITISPVVFNESEYQFVTDLKQWYEIHKATLVSKGAELFLLRNMSQGKGVGFFEAGNFHPDFILWVLVGGKQYIAFIDPHGLLHEGPGSNKVLFHRRIKGIEKRLNDPDVILDSFILSWTRYPQLQWGSSQAELEKEHVLFMTDDRDRYLTKLFSQMQVVILDPTVKTTNCPK